MWFAGGLIITSMYGRLTIIALSQLKEYSISPINCMYMCIFIIFFGVMVQYVLNVLSQVSV